MVIKPDACFWFDFSSNNMGLTARHASSSCVTDLNKDMLCFSRMPSLQSGLPSHVTAVKSVKNDSKYFT